MNYIPIALVMAACTSAHAATIVNEDPAEGGIGYAWTIQIGANETVTTPNVEDANVGVWSWHDTAFAGAENMGWTHTSSWAAVEVTEAVYLTITMGRNASVPFLEGVRDTQYLFPSFTIWSGWDNTGADNHTYQNNGLVPWAEGLTQLQGFVSNTTETTASLTLYLEPGLYTLAMGSHGPATGGLPRQGFYTNFTTVPEPSAALLAAAAMGVMGLRRRR